MKMGVQIGSFFDVTPYTQDCYTIILYFVSDCECDSKVSTLTNLLYKNGLWIFDNKRLYDYSKQTFFMR